MTKRIISLLLAAVLTASFMCACSIDAEEGYPKPTERFFVNDFADIIEEADENEIYSRCASLNDSTTAQVVVVTVEDLNGEEPSDYALNLGREWGVGQKDKDNGIVIILSRDDREVYIAVGGGLEGAMPDSKTGRILDRYGMEYFKADEFSAGLLSVCKAVVNEVYIEYGIEPEESYTPIDSIADSGDEEFSYAGKVAVSWVILIIVVVAYILLFSRRRRGFFWFGGPGPGGFGGGSGGFGGFSGGGGGFSGGGGSFGGGGAGRGF